MNQLRIYATNSVNVLRFPGIRPGYFSSWSNDLDKRLHTRITDKFELALRPGLVLVLGLALGLDLESGLRLGLGLGFSLVLWPFLCLYQSVLISGGWQ